MSTLSSTPLTISNISDVSPDLLRNAVDQRITRIRPMSTPVDQLSRCAASRQAKSMTVEYYTVDTKPTTATLDSALPETGGTRRGDIYVLDIETSDNSIFEPSETVLIPGVNGADGQPIVLYVVASTASALTVSPVNGITVVKNGQMTKGLPAMPEGTVLERMGRAATELDVQTAQFAVLPDKLDNNCQIFKMQIEQSTLARLAAKEVGWTFSDQEEAAVMDMRLGMEKSFLFGQKAIITDPEKHEKVFLTGGIWAQAGRDHNFSLDSLDEGTLISLCRTVFTGQSGSRKKILLAGSELIEVINNTAFTRMALSSQNFVKWGIEFREIVSNFGSLYVLHSEVFDQCGHTTDGIVIDPDYLTKYVHIPFRADTLDLRAAGMRNTDAVVLTEASCLVLRYPQAHCRVHGVK